MTVSGILPRETYQLHLLHVSKKIGKLHTEELDGLSSVSVFASARVAQSGGFAAISTG